MFPTRHLAVPLAALSLLVTAACTSTPDGTTPDLPAAGSGLSRVIMLGDSVAAEHALPLNAALGAAGVELHSMASDGGGNVVGPASGQHWSRLTTTLGSARPSTVIYQITSYDWGTEQEQQAAYQRLLTTVTGAGAKLVVVGTPPVRPDDFYAPHMDDLARAQRVARTVASGAGDRAAFLDAAEVWGDTYQRTHDGIVDRSTDGVHVCPQGAARFTSWLLQKLTGLYPGFTAPKAEEWANTGWAADKHFVGC